MYKYIYLVLYRTKNIINDYMVLQIDGEHAVDGSIQNYFENGSAIVTMSSLYPAEPLFGEKSFDHAKCSLKC